MQWRRRQHETQRLQTGSDILRQVRSSVGAQQHDRPSCAREFGLFVRVDTAERTDDLYVARHQCERLGVPPLQSAKPRHHIALRCIAGELVPTDSLDRYDLALLDEAACRIHVIQHRKLLEANRAPVKSHQPRARSAGMTGDCFGVKPAIRGVLVFRAAVRAHSEPRHRRLLSVVGNTRHDAQARSAIGAVGERVPETPSKRISCLSRTVLAKHRVGRHLRVRASLQALCNDEIVLQNTHIRADFEIIDPAERRRVGLDTVDQIVQQRAFTTGTNQHALSVIHHFANKAELTRIAPHRRPETDSLHPASNPNLDRCLGAFRCHALERAHGSLPQSRIRLLPVSAIAKVCSADDRP